MFSARNPRNWHQLISLIKKVKLPLPETPFRIIREHLVKFKPFSLKGINLRFPGSKYLFIHIIAFCSLIAIKYN